MTVESRTHTTFPDGDWEIVDPLGSGGQGETFLAIERATARRVALKRIHARHLTDLKQLELFYREGQVLRTLDHPAIPKVLDVFHVRAGDAPADLYIAQTWFDGTPLSDIIHKGPRPSVDQLIGWTRDLLGILDYLHTRVPPVFHRDIKPSNIIIQPSGGAALIDFGAVATGWARHDASTLVGTPGFAAPEQFAGIVSARTDLFGLGATVWSALTGRPPVPSAETGRLEIPPDAPAPLLAFLARATSLDPTQRPSSATAAVALLDAKPTADALFAGSPPPDTNPTQNHGLFAGFGPPATNPTQNHGLFAAFDSTAARAPKATFETRRVLEAETALKPVGSAHNPFENRWMRLPARPRYPEGRDAEAYGEFLRDVYATPGAGNHGSTWFIAISIFICLGAGLASGSIMTASILAVIAFALLGVGIFSGSSTPRATGADLSPTTLRELFRDGALVTATISHVRNDAGLEETTPRATVLCHFPTVDGQTEERALVLVGANAKDIAVGDRIPLVVDPLRPEHVVLAVRRPMAPPLAIRMPEREGRG